MESVKKREIKEGPPAGLGRAHPVMLFEVDVCWGGEGGGKRGWGGLVVGFLGCFSLLARTGCPRGYCQCGIWKQGAFRYYGQWEAL